MRVINDHADRTGKKVMFAFNITGDLDEMRRRHDLVLELGGTCVMASLNSVGLVGMIELARFSELPIHAHRNGWGYLSRHPLLGWSFVAWQKIWRLAGADHMHVNGLQNKFSEPDESVIASARACLTPLFDDKPCTVMPVFSSGQSARQAPDTYAAARLGRPDLHGRRRHHGASGRPGGRRRGPARGLGRGRSPASRSPTTPATIRRWRGRWRWLHERAPSPAGRPLLTFYGDDFTGSSAVMEVTAFAGLPTVLFLDPPTPEQLARFADHRVIGIAGIARSQSPDWMDRHLPPVFALLAVARRADRPLQGLLDLRFRPACRLDRARDRHRRADPRRRLAARGGRRPRHGPLPGLRQPVRGRRTASATGSTGTRRWRAIRSRRWTRPTSAATSPGRPRADRAGRLRRHEAGRGRRRPRARASAGTEIVSLDVLDRETLVEAGRLIWENRGERLFAIGSQGLEDALVAYWRSAGLIPAEPGAFRAAPASSGSPAFPDRCRRSRRPRSRSRSSRALRRSRSMRRGDRCCRLGARMRASGRAGARGARRGPRSARLHGGRARTTRRSRRCARRWRPRALRPRRSTTGSAPGSAGCSTACCGRPPDPGGDLGGRHLEPRGLDARHLRPDRDRPDRAGLAAVPGARDDPALAGLEIALKGGQVGRPDFFCAVKRGGTNERTARPRHEEGQRCGSKARLR